MIVKNDYIKIKNGKKTTTLHNYIYDRYLVPFSKTQYDVDEEDVISINVEQQKKELNECYIRFDDKLEDITNATISDFQVQVTSYKNNFSGDNNTINIIYEYDFENGFDLIKGASIDKSDYYNKKITALGFGKNEVIYACLDTSNYDIYVLEDEGLFITRKDIISSQAKCYGYEFPVHLSPIGDLKNAVYNSAVSDYEPKYAKLYSIGLSKTLGTINEEYIIGDDIDIKVKSDTSFGFNLRKGEDVSVYPQNNLYTSNDLYPLPLYVKREIYPQNDMYPDSNLYPSDSNYKYIFYKFRLYLIHWNGPTPKEGTFEIQWLDEYYTMYLENDTKGLFEIVTKIERSDD